MRIQDFLKNDLFNLPKTQSKKEDYKQAGLPDTGGDETS